MWIRQPHFYKEPNAEVIVTLCGPLWNHLHSKTVPHWVWHWLFSTHRVEQTNDQFYTHPPSHPWVCFACHKEGWVLGLYHSCKIAKALPIIIHTHPSNSYNIIHPGLELHTIKKINKPAITQKCQSLDAKAHWSQSCTSFTTNQPERYWLNF